MGKRVAVHTRQPSPYGVACEATLAMETIANEPDGIQTLLATNPGQIIDIQELRRQDVGKLGDIVKTRFAKKGHMQMFGIVKAVMQVAPDHIGDAAVRMVFGHSKNRDWLMNLNGHSRAEKEAAAKMLRAFVQDADSSFVGTFMGDLVGSCAVIRNKMC